MTALRNKMQVSGGYEGPALPQAEYLGLGLLIVVGAGPGRLAARPAAVVLRRPRAGRRSCCPWGSETHYWMPWRLLVHVPLVQNIVPGPFIVVTTLCAAVMLAVVVDRTHASVADLVRRPAGQRPRRWRPGPAPSWAGPWSPRAGGSGRGGRGRGADGRADWPATSRSPPRPVTLPRWFAEVAPHLPPARWCWPYPPPSAWSSPPWPGRRSTRCTSPWWAVADPKACPCGPARNGPGQVVVSAASLSLDGPPADRPANVAALRQALAGWGVTQVVMPDPATLPRYDRGTNPAAALGLFTLAIGRPPRYVDDAWVWSGVRTPAPAVSISATAFAGCTTDAASGDRASRCPTACWRRRVPVGVTADAPPDRRAAAARAERAATSADPGRGLGRLPGAVGRGCGGTSGRRTRPA